MSNIRRSFIFSVLSCCFWISVFGLSPASVASQEPEGEVNDISITRTQHDFGKVFARLSRKLKLAYYNKPYVKILEKNGPFQ